MPASNLIPSWAIETLHIKGLGFEINGLHQEIWVKFQDDFNSHALNREEMPNYFPSFIDHLAKNGWIDTCRSQLKQLPKQPPKRPLKRSAICELEEKIDNFFRSRADHGQLIEFNVVAQCPNCSVKMSITRDELSRGLIDCKSCEEYFNI